jgi:hypothetical protein
MGIWQRKFTNGFRIKAIIIARITGKYIDIIWLAAYSAAITIAVFNQNEIFLGNLVSPVIESLGHA